MNSRAICLHLAARLCSWYDDEAFTWHVRFDRISDGTTLVEGTGFNRELAVTDACTKAAELVESHHAQRALA